MGVGHRGRKTKAKKKRKRQLLENLMQARYNKIHILDKRNRGGAMSGKESVLGPEEGGGKKGFS